MATFQPREFTQILSDALAYVGNHTDLSDNEIGSVVRSTLEAFAYESDEGYFQLTQVLSLFSIFSAEGSDLDRRVADFGITREPAKTATGKARFFNDNLTQSRASLDSGAGSLAVYAFDASVFPTSGYPYVIRIAEGTARSQDVQVTFSNLTTNQFTTTALLYDVLAGDRIALVTGDVARTINSGQQIQRPATASESAKTYTTQEQGFIDAGNYYSNEVAIKATVAGELGNLPAGRINSFQGSSPFAGAGVVNTKPLAGGREEEIDPDLVQRAIEQITGLSRGTVTAIKAAAKGVEDPTTGQRVLSSNIVEDFVNDEVILYIDDGSGFVPDFVPLAESTLSSSIIGTSTVIPLVDGSLFPSAGKVLIEAGSASRLLEYVSKPTQNALFVPGTVADSYTSGTPVYFVEEVASNTEFGQRRFNIRSFPVVRNSETIYKYEPSVQEWVPLTRGVDYKLNKGNGDFILTVALEQGSSLIVHHDYFINLSATVQKVIYGDQNDEVNFPGVSAAGIIVSVEAPTIRRISVRISLTAQPGFTEPDLYDPVRTAVENYITGLKLGEDVAVSKIYGAIESVEGVASARVINPTADVVILESQLASPYNPDGTSLVTIT